MTHHTGDMGKKGKESAADIQRDINRPYAEDKFSDVEKGKAAESSEMIQKQRAFEEGRGHDVTKSTMRTGQGGPEADMEMKESQGQRPHVMQEEEPSTRESSKAGDAMSGSKGTEGTVTRRSGKEQK